MRFWIDEHAFAVGETELLRQALRVSFAPRIAPKQWTGAPTRVVTAAVSQATHEGCCTP